MLAVAEIRGDALLLSEGEFDDLEMLWTVYRDSDDDGGPPAPMQY